MAYFSDAIHEKEVTGRVFGKDMADSGWRIPDFILYKDIKRVTTTCQFIKDDCIYIRVCKA